MVSSPSSWQEALNPQLVRYLLRPIEQPGLISRTLGTALLERVQAFAPATLGDELLQRWGNLLGEHGPSVPIVHATLVQDDGLSYPTWAAQPVKGEPAAAAPSVPARATTPPAEAPPPLPHAPLPATLFPAVPTSADAPSPTPPAPVAPPSPILPASQPATPDAALPSPLPPPPARSVVSDLIQRKEMPGGEASTALPAILPLAPLPPAPPPPSVAETVEPEVAPAPLPERPVVRGVSAPPPAALPVTVILPPLPVVRATPPHPSAHAGPPPTPFVPGVPAISPLPTSPKSETPPVPVLETQRAELPQRFDPPPTRAAELERHPSSASPLRVVRETRRETIPAEPSERRVVLAAPAVARVQAPAAPLRWVVRERGALIPSLPTFPTGSPLPLGLPPTGQAALGGGNAPDTPRASGAATLPSILGAPPVVTGRAVPPSSPASAPIPPLAGSQAGSVAPPAPPPAPEPDMEQIAERVQRRLLQALAVERERRGEGRW